ncbi:putative Phage tape measure protein [Mesorhizobium sp. ORS 3324]|nr:putative Phage tape measure protein [Mesorhizobium sp. ORS 3324]
MADEERLVVALEARIRDFERNMQRASRTAGQQFGSIEARAKVSAARLESSFAAVSGRIGAGLKGLGAGILAGFSLQNAQRLIDQATRISNALKVAGLSAEDLTKVYDQLYASAQRNGAPIEALVTLYGRAAQQQRELGVSSGQLLTFTDDVAVALRVAGTNAGQASGALLQLGQALGSGTVHAEEFNSILEGVPTIAQAAAAGIKEAGGSVAALKQLVVDGKVSSKAFFDGFAAGASTLQEKVRGATMTTSQGFTLLGNSLVRAAGRFDTSTEASKRFGASLGQLAAYVDQLNLDTILSGLDTVAAKLNYVNDLTQSWGEAIGRVTGAENFGKWLAGTKVGEAIGMTSPAGIRDRMAGDVPQADAVVQEWARRHYGNDAATSTTPKTDRLPAASKAEPIALADYPVTGGSGKSKGGTKAKGPDDFEREIAQTQRRIAALQAETAAQAGVNPLVDDYGRAADVARVKQELLNAAQQANVEITPEVAAKIDGLAGSYADASVEARKLADEQDKARENAADWASLERDAVGGFINDLRHGKSAAEALANALDKVVDKLLDMALNSLFTSGGGGLLGGLFSFLGFRDGGYVQAFADGGHVRGPGGPRSDKVPAWLSDGEYVVNAASTAKHRALVEAINSDNVPALASGDALDGGTVGRLHRPANDNVVNTFNLPVSVTVNAQGGDPAQNADLARQTARQTQEAVRQVVISELQTQMRPGGIMVGRGRY